MTNSILGEASCYGGANVMAFVSSVVDESGGFLSASKGCQVSFDATSSVVTDVKVTSMAIAIS